MSAVCLFSLSNKRIKKEHTKVVVGFPLTHSNLNHQYLANLFKRWIETSQDFTFQKLLQNGFGCLVGQWDKKTKKLFSANTDIFD